MREWPVGGREQGESSYAACTGRGGGADGFGEMGWWDGLDWCLRGVSWWQEVCVKLSQNAFNCLGALPKLSRDENKEV